MPPARRPPVPRASPRKIRLASFQLFSEAWRMRKIAMPTMTADSQQILSSRPDALCTPPTVGGNSRLGNLISRQPRLDVINHRTQIATLDIAVNVNAPRIVLAPNFVGCRRNADVSNFCEPDTPAIGRVYQKLANVIDVVAGRRRCPDEHVVNLATTVNVGDFNARHQDIDDTAYVAGLDAKSRGRSSSLVLTMICGTPTCCSACRSTQARNILESVLQFFSLLSQPRQIRSKNSYHDGLTRAAQHLFDPFLEIGLHVSVQPWITRYRSLDTGAGLVIVDLRDRR